MPKELAMSLLFDLYGKVLGVRQREIFEDYYDNDLSLAEIAERFGITRQGVRDYIKRAEARRLRLDAQQDQGRRNDGRYLCGLFLRVIHVHDVAAAALQEPDDGLGLCR